MADDLLFHRVEGSGPPLLLLNGIAMSAASWEPVAAQLRERFKVVRCDLRGQLLSPGPPPPDLAGHVADVTALLDALGLDAVHVLATSFGGAVAALLAARHPGRVRSLVTVASSDGFTEGMAEEVSRWRRAARASVEGPERDALSRALEPAAYSPAWLAAHTAEREAARSAVAALPDRWFRDLIGLLDTAAGLEHGREVLESIRCPTLVVAAGADAFIPRERSRALADAIPGARFTVIEGAGHAVVLERPREVAALTAGHVDGAVRSKG